MSLNRLRKIDTSDPKWAELIRSVLHKCLSVEGVESIYIFGSFASQTMTEDSDIDLAIILKDEINPREFRKNLPKPLSSWPLDLVIVNKNRFEERKNFGGVLFEVAETGIELFPQWRI